MLRWLPFRCAFLLKLYSYKPLYVRDFPLSRIRAPLILVDAAILIPLAFPYPVCASMFSPGGVACYKIDNHGSLLLY